MWTRTGYLTSLRACLALVVLGAAFYAWAQDNYPSRPIRFVVPWPAGGIADARARLIAERLSRSVGQPVIVENRPGASGTIGADLVAKSKPDGYTVYYSSANELALAPELGKVPYDPIRDFTPIVQFSNTPIVLLANAGLNVRSGAELAAFARSQPGKLAYGSPGIAHTNHFAAAMFCKLQGIEVVHVPYKGEAPMLLDLIAGQVQFGFGFVSTAEPQVRAGKLRALLVTGRRRSVPLPDTPTAAEAGMPDLEVSSWAGMHGPAGLPQAIRSRLNQEVRKILWSPEIAQRKEYADAEIAAGTPEEFAAFVAREQARWSKIIRETGVRLEQ